MEEIEQMQQWVEEEVNTRIQNNNKAAHTLHEIDTILEEAYWKFFGKNEQIKEQKTVHHRTNNTFSAEQRPRMENHATNGASTNARLGRKSESSAKIE